MLRISRLSTEWRQALALVAILLAACLLILAHAARSRSEWRVLPDYGGPIKHVVCVLNSARRATLRNASIVTHVINALPKQSRITILTNDRPAFLIAGKRQPERLRLVDLPRQSAFTIWPQDPFLVLESEDGRRVLLASNGFERADDRLLPRSVAKQFGLRVRTSKLTFEGGNIVPGKQRAFVGANTIRLNALRLKIPDTEVVRIFQREIGRRILVLGPLPQPVGHIDMAITAISDREVIVADPRWGASLAMRELRQHPETVRTFERTCRDQFFGNPHVKQVFDRTGKPIRPPKVLGQTRKAAADSIAIAPQLDNLAAELRHWGYEVHRMPFLFCREAPPPASRKPNRKSRPVPSSPKPGYPCLTYNNVLTESVPGRRTVYLPRYGWKALDDAAAEAWKRLGYQIVPVEGFAASAMYGGSLRCCVKVIERG